MEKIRLQVYRYNPDKDAKPYMQDYELEIQPSDVKLLDAIMKLKAQDDTLSFRRSCREGICGSDGMNINGKNGLACLTDIRSLQQPIVLRPLPGLPVIRDLIVDMTQFFKQYHSIKPYVVNDTPAPERERLQTQEERAELDGLYECIRRPVRPAQRLPLHRRQPRHHHQRTFGQPERPIPPVPLPHHHELCGRVSETPEPHTRHRQNQRNHLGAYGLMMCRLLFAFPNPKSSLHSNKESPP